MSEAITVTKLDLPEVLDLGEDGQQWAMRGHLDQHSARVVVFARLLELDALDLLEWIDIGRLWITHRRGFWHSTFHFDPAGEPWTFAR
jgi:hypothetical protein